MSKSNVRIRGIKPSDAEQLTSIYTQPSSLRFLLQLPSSGVAYYSKRIAELSPNQHHFVAEEYFAGTEEKVVGVIGLDVFHNPRMKHTASFWLTVREDRQRVGVGTLLMEAMLDLADNYLNLHRIEAGVLVDNEHAFKLYDKFGFRPEGEKKDCIFREGKYVDCAVIARINPAHIKPALRIVANDSDFISPALRRR